MRPIPRNASTAGPLLIAGVLLTLLLFRSVVVEFVTTWSVYSRTEGARPWLFLMAVLLFARTAGRDLFRPPVRSGWALPPLLLALLGQLASALLDLRLLNRLACGFCLMAVFIFACGRPAFRRSWPAWLLLFFSLPGMPFFFFRTIDPALDGLAQWIAPHDQWAAGGVHPLAVAGLAVFLPAWAVGPPLRRDLALFASLASLPLGRALGAAGGGSWTPAVTTIALGLILRGALRWTNKNEISSPS